LRLRLLFACLCFVHLSYGQECPADMVLAKPGVCIDKYEWPGIPGQRPMLAVSGLPEADGSVEDAEGICMARGMRICQLAEWVSACRGPNGSFSRCVSAAGSYDMVGNAEEWVRCVEGKFGWCLAGGYWAHPQSCTEAIIVHAPNWHLYTTSFRCCADVETT
jgi:hypothetical protein